MHDQDIRAAFQIPASVNLDVDAVALSRSINAAGIVSLDIYLSFEGPTAVDIVPFGPLILRDGAIVCIPGPAVSGWGVSATDGAALVPLGSVLPGSGLLIARENDVDGWVANSGISDETGAPVTMIGDLDGLTLDPLGGSFQTSSTPFPIPNLIFCGDDPTDLAPGLGLSGAGMVSTRSSGQIAQIGGVPMGLPAPLMTLGEHAGLVTLPRVGSLDGLAIARPRTSHFTMDTPTEQLFGAGTLSLELGGGSPAGPAIVLFGLGANAPCGFDPSTFPAPLNFDFPTVYPTVVFSVIPIGANGCGTQALPIPAAIHTALLGNALEFQAFQGPLGGSPVPRVSNPIRIAFL